MRIPTLCIFALLASCASTLPNDRPEAIITSLDWMSGTWSGDMWGGEFVTTYMHPTGGKLLSYSQLLQDGEQAFYEFEVFSFDESGVHMRPFPRGGEVVGFTMTEYDALGRSITFENATKDFPTRVVYRRTGNDQLEILLTDPHTPSDKSEHFLLTRKEP